MTTVFVGVLCLDEILDLDEYPKQDSKVRATRKTLARGGSASNAAVVYQSILKEHHIDAESVHVCSTVGNDAEGLFLIDECRKANVVPSVIVRAGESTPKSIVLRVGDTRTIIHHRTLQELSFIEFNQTFRGTLESDGTAVWVHFEGRNTVETLAMVKNMPTDVKISLELERTRTRDEYLILGCSPDLVVISHAFMEAFGFSDVRLFVETFILPKGLGPKDGKSSLWAFTFGKHGSFGVFFSASGISKIFHCPAKKLDDSCAVDTLGAGDAYLAGLIFAVKQKNLKPEDALKFASRVAFAKLLGDGFSRISYGAITDTKG